MPSRFYSFLARLAWCHNTRVQLSQSALMNKLPGLFDINSFFLSGGAAHMVGASGLVAQGHAETALCISSRKNDAMKNDDKSGMLNQTGR